MDEDEIDFDAIPEYEPGTDFIRDLWELDKGELPEDD